MHRPGNAFADFEDGWMKFVTNKTTVIILGDARGNNNDPRTEILARLSQRSKRIIWLTQGGAPSQFELFDPKPELNRRDGQVHQLEFRQGFTQDVNTAFRAMRDFETGIVYVNAGTTGAETHLPFGGWKDTGNGHREAGHVALDTFTEWKAIYVDYSGRLQRAQIDNQPS